MAEQSTKRCKTTTTASAGGPPFDNLPPELLDLIFVFLDVRTLCTVRLVCAQFRGAASRCLHSVELSIENLRSRPETTLNNFPNLRRVTVFGVTDDDLLMLAQSPVAAAITHLRAGQIVRRAPPRGQIAVWPPGLLLPNLISLTVSHAASHALPFPKTLRELALDAPVRDRTANLLPSLTNLTCLRIDVSGMQEPFEAVTALTALQRLEIACGLPLISLLGELTLLTHLHFRNTWNPGPLTQAWSLHSVLMASLTRLRRLVHLGVAHRITGASELEPQLLAAIGTLTSLRSLDVGLPERPDGSTFQTLWMTPFHQLTALRLESYVLDTSFMPGFNLARLQDLSLSYGVDLHLGGVPALRQATGLTHLQLWRVGSSVGPEELGTALSCMSRLRALSLRSAAQFPAVFCIREVGLPPELTRLELSGRCVITEADLEVFLGLKKLRALRMEVHGTFTPARSEHSTRETVSAIAKLPELCKVEISICSVGWKLRDNFREWLKAGRHERSPLWPPLEFNVSW